MDAIEYVPHKYQHVGYSWVISNPKCGLFLDMGLGKTIITLTAINELMYMALEVRKVLIVAPKKVCESTWQDEAAKWRHTSHLTFTFVSGDERKRKALLKEKTDIHVIARDNVAWLCAQYGGKRLPYDMIILDESSSFKSPSSNRFKALRKASAGCPRMVLLTGTPSPNGLQDLWAPLYLLDQGKRLYQFHATYMREFFYKFDYTVQIRNKESANDIYRRIGDICLSMKASDHLDMPKLIEKVELVRLSKKAKALYDEFEQERIIEILTGRNESAEITALNAASLSGKLLQMAGGAIFDGIGEKTYSIIHNEKLDALEEIIEEAEGPVLVGYWFKHEGERIMARLKKYGARMYKGVAELRDWNAGKIPVLLGQPASMGYGLNLQYGGRIIVYYSSSWSAELDQQFITRVYRQGQTSSVIVKRLVAQGTLDESVVAALSRKKCGQDQLMEAIKARIEEVKKVYLNI